MQRAAVRPTERGRTKGCAKEMNWKHDVALRVIKLLNVLLVAACFAGAWLLYYEDTMLVTYYFRGEVAVIGLYTVLYAMLNRTYDGFLISYNPVSQIVFSQSLAAFLADAIMVVMMWIMAKRFPVLWPGILALIAQVCVITLWAVLANLWYFHSFKPKPTVVVFDAREGMENLIAEYGFDKKFKVRATVPTEECLKDLSCLDSVRTVFLSGVHSHDRNVILKYCVEHDIQAMVIPRIGDVIMSGARRMHMLYLPILRTGRCHLSVEFAAVKRLFDILLSLLALIVLSPIMLVTALAIKLTDHGPVFYKQVRLTRNGREFKVIKFRSMRVDAEKDGVARLSTGTSDDRITPVGRIIRACRVDELPQLINILKGDMSIVGPRPERPEIAAEYEKELPEFRLRLQVKAGLTGYAQVYGKYNTTPYDKLMMDLMYIAHPSVAQDLAIMLATVKILFMKESTEGIEKGQTTAGGTGAKKQ